MRDIYTSQACIERDNFLIGGSVNNNGQMKPIGKRNMTLTLIYLIVITGKYWCEISSNNSNLRNFI